MVAADHIDVKPVDAELPCPSMAEPHLSPQAHARLTAELEERTTSRRRELSHAIERAREHGDIKENADYDAAKNEQGLQRGPDPPTRADAEERGGDRRQHLGRRRRAGNGRRAPLQGRRRLLTYLVGSIEERNEKYDVLSTNSPIGMAILGKGPGDTVTYQGPNREMSVTVVAVRLPD